MYVTLSGDLALASHVGGVCVYVCVSHFVHIFVFYMYLVFCLFNENIAVCMTLYDVFYAIGKKGFQKSREYSLQTKTIPPKRKEAGVGDLA